MWIPAGRDAGGLALFSLCIAYGQATEEIRVLRRQKKKEKADCGSIRCPGAGAGR
jgi:hypothetical protein